MHHPTDRLAYTAAFVMPVVEHWLEREIETLKNPGFIRFKLALPRVQNYLMLDLLVLESGASPASP